MSKSFWFLFASFAIFVVGIGYRMDCAEQEIETLNNELTATNFTAKYGDHGSVKYIEVYSGKTQGVCRVSSINKERAVVHLVDMYGYKSTKKLNNKNFFRTSKEGIKSYKETYIQCQKMELEDK